MQWMGENGVTFSIKFTIADKMKPGANERNLQNYLDQLLSGVWEEVPKHFITSSSNGMGREEVLDYIGEINENFFEKI